VELIVAIGGDDKRRNGLNPADEQPEHVKRRLVRPVDVLEHEDGRSAYAKLLDQRGDDLIRHRAALQQSGELAFRLLRDLEQWAQRTGREQRLAGAPEQAGRRAVAELTDQRRLADARFTPHEHDASSRRRLDGLEQVAEQRQLVGSLQQPTDRRRHSLGRCPRHQRMMHFRRLSLKCPQYLTGGGRIWPGRLRCSAVCRYRPAIKQPAELLSVSLGAVW
jgi:hypothetical protein